MYLTNVVLTKFQFKQFEVEQSKSAMKIGTDSVLLGAWTPIINNPYSILDIGAGTGILSLMLAQRTIANQIDAIEIDADAFEECTANFENSPWNDRIYCFHCSLDEFTNELIEENETHQYDLIISNPPFFSEDYKSPNEKREIARFEEALPFEELIKSIDILLTEEGVFSLIIPYKEETKIKNLAEKFNLFPFEIMRIKGKPDSSIKRSMIAFSRKNTICKIEELVIEYSRHIFSEKYIELTKDFYLKM